jgi:hypothetical protein
MSLFITLKPVILSGPESALADSGESKDLHFLAIDLRKEAVLRIFARILPGGAL